MNSSFYLFGDFGRGVISYPIDYAQSIFEKFVAESKAPTQMIIHRDGEIINYGYVRKIENNHLFGICIQINGQYFSTTKRLFEIFEDITAYITVRGELIRLDEQGNLVESVTRFADKPNEVERITDYCRNELSKLEHLCKKLPPIDYSTSNGDKSYFKEDDNSTKIITTALKNGYTFVYKKDDFDTLALAGYRSTLSALNTKFNQASNKVQELNKELATLKRQKKQMGVVACLILVLFIGSIIFFNTIEEKDKNIKEQAATIVQQGSENKRLTNEKAELHHDNSYLNDRVNELTEMYNEKVDNCTRLERLYNNSINENKQVKANILNYQKELERVKATNKELERKCNESNIQSDKYLRENNELLSRYNQLMKEFNNMKYKYYSTKEGKKELKKKN